MWLLWTAVLGTVMYALQDEDIASPEFVAKIPDLIIMVVLYALIPAVVLQAVHFLASVATIGVLYYLGLDFFGFIPILVLLIKAGVNAPIGVALAVTSVYLNSWGFLLALSVVAVLTYFDVFLTVQFKPETVSGFTFFYRDHVGPYNSIHKVFSSLTADASKNHLIAAFDGMAGMYFDDPAKVPAEKCRSQAGFVAQGPLTDKNAALAASIGLKSRVIPTAKHMVARFPVKQQMISMLVAIFKVYPAAKRHTPSLFVKGNTAAIEKYEAASTNFLFPQENIEAFAHI